MDDLSRATHSGSAPMPPVTDGLHTPRRYFATAAVLAAIVLAVLDGAIANVALPTISQKLNVSPAASIWVVTGYQLARIARGFRSSTLELPLEIRKHQRNHNCAEPANPINLNSANRF